MYWNKILKHMFFYAAELEATGYKVEAEYIRTSIIPFMEAECAKRQEDGKRMLLALVKRKLNKKDNGIFEQSEYE